VVPESRPVPTSFIEVSSFLFISGFSFSPSHKNILYCLYTRLTIKFRAVDKISYSINYALNDICGNRLHPNTHATILSLKQH